MDWNSVGAAVGALVAIGTVFVTFFRDRDKTRVDVGSTYVTGMGDVMTAARELRTELQGQVAELRAELRLEREECARELQIERDRCDAQIGELRATIGAIARRLDDDTDLEFSELVEFDLD